MPNQHDPWEPGEQIDSDIPEHAGDIEIENNPPSEAAADEFFGQEDIEAILDEGLLNAQKTINAGNLEEKNIRRAREHYNKNGGAANTGPTYKPEIEELKDRS